MKLAIMQPYFLPYPGYFALIKHTHKFILLDDVQFIRHGWIERNRILNQNEGWLYIKVPVIKESGRETLIRQTFIDNKISWQKKIMAQLQVYRNKAAYYHKVSGLLEELFSHDYDSIVSLSQASLKIVCDYIGIEHNIEVFSKMNIVIDKPDAPDEWALNICKSLGGVDEYWNPPGGMSFFNSLKYASAGIELKFMIYNQARYPQLRNDFESGLSIVDALMFNAPEVVNGMLDSIEIVQSNP